MVHNHVWFFGAPWDYNLQGFSVSGANKKAVEWVAKATSEDLPSRDEPMYSQGIAGQSFTI